MNLQVLDGLAGVQLFLTSLISNPELQTIMEGIIHGGYEFSFRFSEDKGFGSVGSIAITSKFIGACMPQYSGKNSAVFDYVYGKSLADDTSLLYLIWNCFEDEESAEEGDEWRF